MKEPNDFRKLRRRSQSRLLSSHDPIVTGQRGRYKTLIWTPLRHGCGGFGAHEHELAVLSVDANRVAIAELAFEQP